MRSRSIIGCIATILYAKRFVTINKLQFDHPFTKNSSKGQQTASASQQLSQPTYKKGSWLLSFRNIHTITNHFPNPQINDIVLVQQPNGQYVFKVIGAVSNSYTPFNSGASHYVPPGFVFLINPIKKEIGMEHKAVISAQTHINLGQWGADSSEKVCQSLQKTKCLDGQKQAQQQILQDNQIKQQIQEFKKAHKKSIK